jgi:hypothetical protein
MPKYELGEPIPFTQHIDINVNVFGIRKYMEQFGLNEIDFFMVKIKNPVAYALAIDLEKSKFDTADEVLKYVCAKLNIEYDIQKLSEIFNKVITQNLYH